MKLQLGVNDVPYSDEKGKTTGDVAEILEDKYGVMGTFYEMHGQEIADDLTEAIAGELESILQGKPISNSGPFGQAEFSIQQRFQKFLDNKEMDGKVPGVPTAASGGTEKRKGGINHRLMHPYAKANPARPSFIDSGEYQAHMAAKISEE